MKRGLKGVRLVISDAHEGLKQAIATVSTGTTWQRCRVHFIAQSAGARAARHPRGDRGDCPDRSCESMKQTATSTLSSTTQEILADRVTVTELTNDATNFHHLTGTTHQPRCETVPGHIVMCCFDGLSDYQSVATPESFRTRVFPIEQTPSCRSLTVRALSREASAERRCRSRTSRRTAHHRKIVIALLVPRKRDGLHKSRSAAPGSQGATTEHIGDVREEQRREAGRPAREFMRVTTFPGD